MNNDHQGAKSGTMPIFAIFVCLVSIAAVALLQGCQSWFHPRWTPYEKAILKFNVQGITMGSPPSHLKIFTQVKKDPTSPDGMMVFQIFNPNPHISMMLAWYENNRLKKVELRYFNAGAVDTLTVSGGWDGLMNALMKDFGPPSEFGPKVTVVATQAGIDPTAAQFNGVWFFSRVDRQLNYVTVNNETGGIGIITVADTSPPAKKQLKQKKKEEPFPQAQPPPPATKPGPGFGI